MGKVLIRFYEELNDFLPPGKRKKDVEASLHGNETVREIIERLGVPAEKVDLLLLNGRSASLEEFVKEGDRISVYPVFERFNIRDVSRVREKPLRRLRFIADSDLRGLGQALARLGLDVFLGSDLDASQILQVAKAEHRVLLTGRSELSRFQEIDRVIVIRPGTLEEQVHQVTNALDLRVEPEQGIP